ncbi:MAG: ATP synthase F1 subunit gamma [Candidatus Saccharibacteria bacterium]|nr:ATP synthase F1 subunit gamma [Candidatus Saccharibacteria bacterium]
MASTRQLKGRIRSVKSTKQITKAMQLVAASKMRRAQDSASATDSYAQTAAELLTRLSRDGETKTHSLYAERTVKNRIVIVITSNRGLAGAYNSNVLKQYINRLKEDDSVKVTTSAIAIGKKGAQLATRLKNDHVIGVYNELMEHPTGPALKAVVNTIVEQFATKKVDAVEVIYTKYINSLSQVVTTLPLLPAGFTEVEPSEHMTQAIFEPSASEVLEAATIRLIEAQLFQSILDSVASEHSMRMMAMKNATDNATDLIDDLTLAMNKLRQADITQELAEISGGVEAMKV